MFQKILLPLDGSPFAEFARPYAAEIARTAGGDVEVVMVHDPVPPFAFGEWDREPHPWKEEYLEFVEGELRGYTGGTVTHALPVGEVPDALAEHVEKTEPDLVVMATHGRGPLSRFWLGGVADHLIRHARRPLLFVRPSEDRERLAPGAVRFRRVLIPLDGSELAEGVLDPGLDLVDFFEAEATLVQVVPSLPLLTSSYLPDTADVDRQILEERREEPKAYIEEVADRLADEGRSVEIDVRIGHPATAIRQATVEHGADLVALATHGRGGVSRAVLGSVADKVIRGGDLPTLVCPLRRSS